MKNRSEQNLGATSSPERENTKAKANELLVVLSREIANIHEIVDGGWGLFPIGQSDLRNVIWDCLREIKKELEGSFEIKSEPQRYDYRLLQDGSKYLETLRIKLENIKLIIDGIEASPEAKARLQHQIQKAIDTYGLLDIES